MIAMIPSRSVPIPANLGYDAPSIPSYDASGLTSVVFTTSTIAGSLVYNAPPDEPVNPINPLGA